MTMTDMVNDAKKMLQDLIRKHKFKKANLERKERAELTAEIAKCNGKLNMCKASYRAAIREQHTYIKEGINSGFDTIPQEQILWDAAIGYMLVEDAMYALKSIGSYDSMTRAYSMLDAATKPITGKKSSLAKSRIGGGKDRDVYDNINSEELKREKEELLSGFFEELKLTGDIDACLKNATHPLGVEAQRRAVYTGSPTPTSVPPTVKSKASAFDDMLGSDLEEPENFDYDDLVRNSITNSKPPKTESEG